MPSDALSILDGQKQRALPRDPEKSIKSIFVRVYFQQELYISFEIPGNRSIGDVMGFVLKMIGDKMLVDLKFLNRENFKIERKIFWKKIFFPNLKKKKNFLFISISAWTNSTTTCSRAHVKLSGSVLNGNLCENHRRRRLFGIPSSQSNDFLRFELSIDFFSQTHISLADYATIIGAEMEKPINFYIFIKKWKQVEWNEKDELEHWFFEQINLFFTFFFWIFSGFQFGKFEKIIKNAWK